MIVIKKSEKYYLQENNNICNVEINFLTKTYEIYRRQIKDESFIKEVEKFAQEKLLLNHIVSHNDLIEGKNYMVFLNDKWNPVVVYAPYKPGDLYFKFLNGMHKSCLEIKIENIKNIIY